MERLKMHTPNLTDENYRKLAALFPNAVTETINKDGEVVRAIDADVLRQEISAEVVEGAQERYQFTWPDKKKSVVLANQPIVKTLRLEREKSVGRDGTPGNIDTENIYIEGDNLDALKLLRETYLGKVKMIYIDPPYNTGSDAFVYNDDFAESGGAFAEASGQRDEEGNLLFDLRVNNESNGRFHTDWLNMLYPRLRIAKDLLADDGVIFISIDDNELETLITIGKEIFGEGNYESCVTWRRRTNQPNDKSKMIAKVAENIVVFSKNTLILSGKKAFHGVPLTEERKNEYKNLDNDPRGAWSTNPWKAAVGRGGSKYTIITPTGKSYTETWYGTEGTFQTLLSENRVYWTDQGNGYPRIKIYLSDAEKDGQAAINFFTHERFGSNQEGSAEVEKLFSKKGIFDNPKPIKLILSLIRLASNSNSVILDFFSGSATTAHAVMQLNAEDGGNRKFIMVQLPELIAKENDAYKAGYKNICEIGEERIRRAGKKIKEETGADIDYGFRVFRVDSTNMNDVYYRPQDFKQGDMGLFADNIKADRTPEDLLFQVMLDLGVLLSSKIEETVIAGKKVFSVADGYLMACFDDNVTEKTVKAIAQRKPFYAVFRDSGMASDSVITNFEQIFETYSPQTKRKVL